MNWQDDKRFGVFYSPTPPLMEVEVLAGYVLHECADLLVVNKPGWIVCHPSKHGPGSSLVGACREYTGLEALHIVNRLDRETSGLVILAKTQAVAAVYQKAMEKRQVKKAYCAILEGRLEEAVLVDGAIGKVQGGPVWVEHTVGEGAGYKASETYFEPVKVGAAHTFVKVEPRTGRTHQIRVHARHIGHSILGDKLYGPDRTLYLDFIEHGWTERMHNMLPFPRQALHCSCLEFDVDAGGLPVRFEAPLMPEMEIFLTDEAF